MVDSNIVFIKYLNRLQSWISGCTLISFYIYLLQNLQVLSWIQEKGLINKLAALR